MTETKTPPPSDRARLRRYHWLAHYERETINAIIDAGIVCQVGYVIDGMPYVTPTCHWRIDDHVYWHGSSASRMLKAQQKGIPVCFTVTHLDGVVFSRAAFNHNILYRSVMAFGEAELVDEETKRAVLQVFVDRLAPGLWDYARPPAEQEDITVSSNDVKVEEDVFEETYLTTSRPSVGLASKIKRKKKPQVVVSNIEELHEAILS